LNIIGIIVNYNSEELIIKCLETIALYDRSVSEIIIVDNSGELGKNFEESCFKVSGISFQILKPVINLGYTGGVNLAIRNLLESRKEINYIFTLNPDAYLVEDSITILCNELVLNNGSIISPEIRDLNDKLWFSGGVLNRAGGYVQNSKLLINSKGTIEVDFFNGCLALFDFNVFKTIHLFNEELFMYFDELEYSIRAKNIGLKILYTNTTHIFHDVSATIRDKNYLKNYYYFRNYIFVFKKFGISNNLILFENVVLNILRTLRKFKFKSALYLFIGVCHGLINRMGKFKMMQ
jgi:GT2 family glycosyltransferase